HDPCLEASELGERTHEEAPDQEPQRGRPVRRAGTTDDRRIELQLRPLEHLPRALVVPLGREHHALIELGLRREEPVAHGTGDGQGTLARLHRGIQLADRPEVVAQIAGDATQPSLIADALRERLRLNELLTYPGGLPERPERVAKRQSERESLLQGRGRLGQVAEGQQGLVEDLDGLAVGRGKEGAPAGPAEILDGLGPLLAVKRVVRQTTELLAGW